MAKGVEIISWLLVSFLCVDGMRMPLFSGAGNGDGGRTPFSCPLQSGVENQMGRWNANGMK